MERRLLPGGGPRLAALAARCSSAFRAGLVLAAAGVALAVGMGAPAPAGAAPARPGAPGASTLRHSTGTPWYYLALGASESVGVQPVPGTRHGVRTDEGYTNDLAAIESARWPGLQLVELGCPGITAQAALDGAGPCSYPAGSEIATAVAFLEAHPARVAFVTVDLGFNDVRPCLVHDAVDEACVDGALALVTTAVDTTLAELREAGGPHLLVVGLEHDDPYLADARGQDAPRAFAQETVSVFDRLNDALDSAYRAAGAVIARVPDAFGNRHPGASPPSTESKAVTQTCADTWMCTLHNVHPTRAGYLAIADAVADAIASSTRGGG